MFRFLCVVLVAICISDRAIVALITGRIAVFGGNLLRRKRSLIAFWTLTSLWCALSYGAFGGIVVLSYLALSGSGPYREHAFFSLHQAWPYAAIAVLLGGLAAMIIRDQYVMFRALSLRKRRREGR